jgi:hypothetical protein
MMTTCSATTCWMERLPLVFCFLLLFLLPSLGEAAQCTLCPDRSFIQQEADAAKPLTLPGLKAAIQTCGDAELFARETLLVESDTCKTLHSISSYCGCPISTPEACTLCPDGSSVGPASLATPIPNFPMPYSDSVPAQCAFVEATLHNIPNNSASCTQGQQLAATICGCPITAFRRAAANTEGCQLCRHGGGSIMAFPNKNVSATLEKGGMLQSILDAGLPPICSVVAGLVLNTMQHDTKQCHKAQAGLGGICGCAPVPGYCDFCPNDDNDNIPYPDQLLYPLEKLAGSLFSCTDLNLTWTQFSKNSDMCFGSRQFNFLCGCNNGERIYLGADTETKRAFLAWIPRVSGSASLLGSLFIIWDVLRDKKK